MSLPPEVVRRSDPPNTIWLDPGQPHYRRASPRFADVVAPPNTIHVEIRMYCATADQCKKWRRRDRPASVIQRLTHPRASFTDQKKRSTGRGHHLQTGCSMTGISVPPPLIGEPWPGPPHDLFMVSVKFHCFGGGGDESTTRHGHRCWKQLHQAGRIKDHYRARGRQPPRPWFSSRRS